MPKVPNLSSQYIVLIRYSCCMLSAYSQDRDVVSKKVNDMRRMIMIKKAVRITKVQTYRAEIVSDLFERLVVLLFEY